MPFSILHNISLFFSYLFYLFIYTAFFSTLPLTLKAQKCTCLDGTDCSGTAEQFCGWELAQVPTL